MAMSGVKITEKDLGWKNIKAEIKKLNKKPFVKIGVLGAEAEAQHESSDENITVAQIATIHEYGAPSRNIPERSFIRATVQRNIGKYHAIIRALKEKVLDPKSTMDAGTALKLLGEKVLADVRTTLTSSEGLKPLSPRTIAGRTKPSKDNGKSPKPLIDTGQMLNSTNYVVEMDGKK